MNTHTPKPVFIASAKRSPVGRFGGALQSVSAVETAREVVEKTLSESMREACNLIVAGQVIQAGCGMNPARQAALRANLHHEIPAYTVNMVCGSGLKAVADIADAIASGRISCGAGLGMESMSQAPYYSPSARWGGKYGDSTHVDALLKDGLTDPTLDISMGETAERVADEFSISREEQDAFALLSQERAAAARESYRREIIPIPTSAGLFEEDEHPRPDTTAEKLSALKPVFRPQGTVTAGNASGLNDGAAALFLSDSPSMEKNGWAPLARIVDWVVCGCYPATMGLGPVGAIRKLCARTGWTLDEVDTVEINEAFAAQILACIRELDLPLEKVNPRGGGIALGHPIGCSGARILVSLVHELRRNRGRRGIAALCIGGGMGIAMAVEVP